MENDTCASLVSAKGEASSSQSVQISSKKCRSELERAFVNVRGAKGLARKLPSTLIGVDPNKDSSNLCATTMESTSLKTSVRGYDVKLTSVTDARASTACGEKRSGRKLLPNISKRRIFERLQETKMTCNQAEVKQAASVDRIIDHISSLEVEGGCLWRVKEEVAQLKNETSSRQMFLETRISQIELNQEKILLMLEGIRSQKMENEDAFHYAILELRSASNKLSALAKIQSSSIGELKSTTNRLNAMIRCHLEKPRAPPGNNPL